MKSLSYRLKINRYLFAAFSIFILGYNWFQGLVLSSDSYTYILWAEQLIDNNLSFFEFHKSKESSFIYFFYDFFLLYIALLKLIFNESWQTAFFSLNLLYLGISLKIFHELSDFSRNEFKINIILIALLILSIDFLIWPHFLLTESIFIMLFMSSIFFYREYFIESNTRNKICLLGFIIFSILSLFTKPGSIGLLSGLLFFHIFKNVRWFKDEFLIKIFFAGLIFFIPFLFEFVLNSLNDSNNFKISQLIGYAQSGFIISDRESTYIISDSTNLRDVFLMRLFYFFIPIVPEMSKLHIFADSLFALVLILSLLTWTHYSNRYSVHSKMLCKLMLCIFLFSAFYHSATLIDYDWRYRFPSLMPMVLFVFYNLKEIFLIYDRSSNSSL
jgi:hypothetical protein